MFDIDKLYLAAILYKVDRKEGEDGKYHLTVTDQFDEKKDAYYANLLIRDYITLLLDWKSPTDHECRSMNFLHKSIDNDTQLLKDVIKDLESGKQDATEVPYGFYSLTALTESKNDYLTGKIGIGPFALNNNNHILTILYHVKFKHILSSIMNELGLESLDKRFDQDGNSILSWISGLINAHVDIARDPFISKLNVNPFTYNLVNLLVRTGLGEKTFYFTTQPIMKALSLAYSDASAVYMREKNGSIYFALQEAIDLVIKDWFAESNVKIDGVDVKTAIDRIKDGGVKNREFRASVNKLIKELFDKSIKSDAKSNDIDMQHQLLYYLAYLQFDRYANALSSLVLYSKIDTKKHGKSIAELFVYNQGYRDVYDTSRESNLFEPSGLKRMREDSYIGKKTLNAIDTTNDILRTQFIECSPGFKTAVNDVLRRIGRADSLSSTLVSKVYSAVSAAIKSKFFVDTYVPQISENPDFIHDLISDSCDSANFAVYQEGFEVKIDGKLHHDLQSYVGTRVEFDVVMSDGTTRKSSRMIQSVNESNNSIIVDKKCVPSYGKVVLRGGKNTIYDRLLRLTVAIASDPEYSKLNDGAGNTNNALLLMLVPSTQIDYISNNIIGEAPDTYQNMKFVKFFNFVDDGGSSANYIIEAWDELLNYTDDNKRVQDEVRTFARDLIVYGFITSGDLGGFTKIFKYVPASWRIDSGYGDFILSKLVDLNMGAVSDIDIDDIILNNWFDDDFVRKYSFKDKNKVANFIQYKPTINGKKLSYASMLAALKMEDGKFVPSIDPQNPPAFIKLKRRSDKGAYDSQRQYTIYKLVGIAKSNKGVEYPVYVKVNPKGNRTSSNFLITEYGRNDAVKSVPTQREYSISIEQIRDIYRSDNVVNQITNMAKVDTSLASMMEGLARNYNEDYLEERPETLNQKSTQQKQYDDSDLSDDAMKICKI